MRERKIKKILLLWGLGNNCPHTMLLRQRTQAVPFDSSSEGSGVLEAEDEFPILVGSDEEVPPAVLLAQMEDADKEDEDAVVSEEEEAPARHDAWTLISVPLQERGSVSRALGGPRSCAAYHSPVDFFFAFLSHEFWEDVLQETNRYKDNSDARPRGGRTIKERFSDISDIELHELYRFIGILLLFGVLHVHGSKRDMWSSDPLLGIQGIADTMSRARYEAIRACFHIQNDSANPMEDKFLKVRKLLSEMERTCHYHFELAGSCDLDEQVVRGYGRLPRGLKLKFKNKPVKEGLRVESINHSRTGYMHSFIMAGDFLEVEKWFRGEQDLGESRKRYIAAILKANSKIDSSRKAGTVFVMDNLFTCEALAIALLPHHVHILGTWRKNFGVPKILRSEKLSNDKKIVVAHKTIAVPSNRGRASEYTLYGAKIEGTNSKKAGFYMLTTSPAISFGEVQNVNVPFVRDQDELGKKVYDIQQVYNMNMNGTDKFDQLRQSYEIHMRPRKWWWGVFLWGLNSMIVNAYICYRELAALPMSHKEFRLAIIRWLLTATPENAPSPESKRAAPSPVASKDVFNRARQNRKTGQHLCVEDPRYNKETNNRRECIWCKYLEKNPVSKTRMICEACSVPLCLDCFRAFHG